MKEGPIVCLGIMVADVVGRPLREVPDPGRLALVEEMSLHAGGCAVNAATALARFGLPVEVIGKVGLDPFGDFLVGELAARGIGGRGVRRDPARGTSATMVMVGPDGERRFVHYIGANAGLTPADVAADAVAELIAGASILHVAGALVLPGIDGRPTADLLRQARAAGVVTFLDTVWDAAGRWMELLRPCLPYVDYFVPSLPEAQALTGLDDPEAAARALHAAGAGVAALKMGEAGSLVYPIRSETGEDVAAHFPAYDVEAVDATGAGDAFAAGFIAGVRLGRSLEETARLANATGALAVMGVGAEGATRSLEETERFMAATPLRR